MCVETKNWTSRTSPGSEALIMGWPGIFRTVSTGAETDLRQRAVSLKGVWADRLVLMKPGAGNASSENPLPHCSCGVMKSRGRQEMRWIAHSALIGPMAAPWKTQPLCQLAVDFLSGPAIDWCESFHWRAGGRRLMVETEVWVNGKKKTLKDAADAVLFSCLILMRTELKISGLCSAFLWTVNRWTSAELHMKEPNMRVTPESRCDQATAIISTISWELELISPGTNGHRLVRPVSFCTEYWEPSKQSEPVSPAVHQSGSRWRHNRWIMSQIWP